MKKIEIGDVLRCITDEEPPFNNLKVGDKVEVITINSYNDVLIEFDGHRDWCRIGDLYLNFENLNKTTEGEEVPEDVQFSHMVKALAKSGEAIKAEMTAQNANLLHMVIGISGEAGELLDAVKKAVIYQKPLDIVNVIEELGDLEFYMEGLRQELRITREETLQATIDKLAVRYKGLKYSDTSAQERADKA